MLATRVKINWAVRFFFWNEELLNPQLNHAITLFESMLKEFLTENKIICTYI